MIKEEDIVEDNLVIFDENIIDDGDTGVYYHYVCCGPCYVTNSQEKVKFRIGRIKSGDTYIYLFPTENVTLDTGIKLNDFRMESFWIEKFGTLAYEGLYSVLKKESESEEKIFDDIKPEQVSHPSHYAWLKELCGVEPLDVCRHLDFNVGNAIKYLLRKDKVDGDKTKKEKRIEDLRKAVFYIEDEIKLLKDGKE